MRTKQETRIELMASWAQAWTTLGRWQDLNARLASSATPLTSGWARRSSLTCEWHAVTTAVSTPRAQAGS